MLTGELKGRRPHLRSVGSCEDNFKMDIKIPACDYEQWI
jgi:hypothetical protein